jgi:hypothetical protein
MGVKGVKESNGRGEWTNVKYTHGGIHWETPSNINSNINNEKQDYKIGRMCSGRVPMAGGRVNEGN